MKQISLPTNIKITEDKDNKNRALITIEPCYPGYGLTIGNALRRVLLSSLPGAAVTAFKIKGVQHEFSTMPGMKEDIVELILNLKQLRLRIATDEPVELALNSKGEKSVTAANIEKNADVEIVNPDLLICNLTDRNAKLEMKIWVERGMGYAPVEERKDSKPEIGVIQIDALYTPVMLAAFRRENVRVGDRTDYDQLTLDIETDGSITPEVAYKQAAAILVEQFSCIANGGKEEESSDEESPKVEVSELENEISESNEKNEEKPKNKDNEENDDAVLKLKKRGRPKKKL